jgi:N-acetylmuramoyl-L-alanine amidase
MRMARHALARLVVAAAAVCASSVVAQTEGAASANPAAITDIRFWSLSGSTRVAIELSGEVKFRYEGLSNPERLFIDLSGARLALRGRGLRVIPVGDELVRQVRVAETRPQVIRVVLDLAGESDYEITQLTNPARVMVEVRAKGRAPAVVSSAAPPPAPEPPAEKTKPPPASPPQTSPPSSERKPAEPAIAAVVEPAPAPRPPEPGPAAPPPAAGPKAESADLAAAPKPAKPSPRGRPSMTRALGLKLGKVVIDAGHGGQDHGTTGPAGLTEKELVLDIAMRLGALIEQRMGSEVLFTRTEDVFVPLEERTAFANQNRADLFISIHANSSSLKHISGSEVYFLNFTTNRDALEVAARENAGTGKSIFELRELLQKIALKEKRDESREFAAKVQSALHATWYRMNSRARNRGVKQAPFVVLIGANMPSILTEIGFISNPRDEALLKKPEHRQRVAEGLFKGISQYASTLSQMQIAHRAAAP